MATKTGARKGGHEKVASTGVKRTKAGAPKPAAPKSRGTAIDAARLAELDASIALLAGWTGDVSERVRRFASEALRPRGVWAGHIAALKRQPEKGLPILEPLRADPAVYVQDSVANWLNDAAKDQPDWVREVCGRWQAERPEDGNTQRIVRRALRSLS